MQRFLNIGKGRTQIDQDALISSHFDFFCSYSNYGLRNVDMLGAQKYPDEYF